MPRRISQTENKLFVLRAVDLLGPLTDQQLLTFMAENALMEYLDMQLGLSELLSAGFLRCGRHPLGTLYAITPEGRESLTLFQDKIPRSRLTLLESLSVDWRERFRREKQMPTSFEPLEDGSYRACMRLQEQGRELMTLQLNMPSRDTAQGITDAWLHSAAEVYEAVLHILCQNLPIPGEHPEISDHIE